MSQLAFDNMVSTELFLPTAARLHAGDELEGYGGRALPRRRHVLGVVTDAGSTRIIYRERRGSEDHFDVMDLPADTPVDIAPPF